MKARLVALAAIVSIAGGVAHTQVFLPPPPEAAGPAPPPVFSQMCASCHGPRGDGERAPPIVGPFYRHGMDDASIVASIRHGYPDLGMPSFASLPDSDVQSILAYVRARRSGTTETPKAKPASAPTAKIPQGVVRTARAAFRIETLVKVPHPYGMAFLPDGRMLITQTSGALRIFENGRLLPDAVVGTPSGKPAADYFHRTMLDVAVGAGGWIYLTSGEGMPDGAARMTVSRGHIRDGRWVDGQTLLQYATNGVTNNKIAIDQKGFVYIGTPPGVGLPETSTPEREAPQDLSQPEGKIIRMAPDGGVPEDNPFVNLKGAYPYVWSVGHRSVMGLTFDPQGRLWSTEDGPRGGDELNLIEKGKNYGWPVITWGHRYDQMMVASNPEQPGMEQPIVSWVPSPALSAALFYTGSAFPGWKDSLLVGTLKARSLYRIVIADNHPVEQETVLYDMDRIRDIKQGPDGLIYMLTDSGDLLRLVPQERDSRRAELKQRR
jgi:glucose/arabinose dehydrogenase